MALDRRTLFGVTALLVAPCGLGLASACSSATGAAGFEAILERVRNLVENHHYSRGQSTQAWRTWRSDAERYRSQARIVGTRIEFYINLLTPMLSVFGDDHTFVRPPSPAPAPGTAQKDAPTSPPPWSGDVGAGQGFDMTFFRGALVVTSVTKGSLADRNDVEPGAEVLSYSLAPQIGAAPRLKMRVRNRNAAPRDLNYVLEDRPPPPPLEVTKLGAARTLLRFDRFSPDLAPACEQVLREAGSGGLILDLRRNAGGDTEVCRRLMGVLVGDGQTIADFVARGRQTAWRTQTSLPPIQTPLVVLVGPTTSSAAEVMAADLQERGRAKIVGGATAGAVLFSALYSLKDGGVLSIAEKDVFTPNGRRLEGVGVQPDHLVEATLPAIRAGRDLVVEAAEAILDQGGQV